MFARQGSSFFPTRRPDLTQLGTVRAAPKAGCGIQLVDSFSVLVDAVTLKPVLRIPPNGKGVAPASAIVTVVMNEAGYEHGCAAYRDLCKDIREGEEKEASAYVGSGDLCRHIQACLRPRPVASVDELLASSEVNDALGDLKDREDMLYTDGAMYLSTLTGTNAAAKDLVTQLTVEEASGATQAGGGGPAIHMIDARTVSKCDDRSILAAYALMRAVNDPGARTFEELLCLRYALGRDKHGQKKSLSLMPLSAAAADANARLATMAATFSAELSKAFEAKSAFETAYVVVRFMYPEDPELDKREVSVPRPRASASEGGGGPEGDEPKAGMSANAFDSGLAASMAAVLASDEDDEDYELCHPFDEAEKCNANIALSSTALSGANAHAFTQGFSAKADYVVRFMFPSAGVCRHVMANAKQDIPSPVSRMETGYIETSTIPGRSAHDIATIAYACFVSQMGVGPRSTPKARAAGGMSMALAVEMGAYMDSEEVSIGRGHEDLIVTCVIEPAVVDHVVMLAHEPEQVWLMHYMRVIGYQKSGHSGTAANAPDTIVAIAKALSGGYYTDPAAVAAEAPAGVYHWPHGGSIRYTAAFLIYTARNGEISYALTRRLFVHGPGVVGYVLAAKFLSVLDRANFFQLVNLQPAYDDFHVAYSAWIVDAWKTTPYANYMYGESRPASATFASRVAPLMAYCAHVEMIMPDSSYASSVALQKIAGAAADNDIASGFHIMGFTGAIQTFIQRTVRGKMVGSGSSQMMLDA